jgi:hypothetical protein
MFNNNNCLALRRVHVRPQRIGSAPQVGFKAGRGGGVIIAMLLQQF